MGKLFVMLFAFLPALPTGRQAAGRCSCFHDRLVINATATAPLPFSTYLINMTISRLFFSFYHNTHITQLTPNMTAKTRAPDLRYGAQHTLLAPPLLTAFARGAA